MARMTEKPEQATREMVKWLQQQELDRAKRNAPPAGTRHSMAPGFGWDHKDWQRRQREAAAKRQQKKAERQQKHDARRADQKRRSDEAAQRHQERKARQAEGKRPWDRSRGGSPHAYGGLAAGGSNLAGLKNQAFSSPAQREAAGLPPAGPGGAAGAMGAGGSQPVGWRGGSTMGRPNLLGNIGPNSMQGGAGGSPAGPRLPGIPGPGRSPFGPGGALGAAGPPGQAGAAGPPNLPYNPTDPHVPMGTFGEGVGGVDWSIKNPYGTELHPSDMDRLASPVGGWGSLGPVPHPGMTNLGFREAEQARLEAEDALRPDLPPHLGGPPEPQQQTTFGPDNPFVVPFPFEPTEREAGMARIQGIFPNIETGPPGPHSRMDVTENLGAGPQVYPDINSDRTIEPTPTGQFFPGPPVPMPPAAPWEPHRSGMPPATPPVGNQPNTGPPDMNAPNMGVSLGSNPALNTLAVNGGAMPARPKPLRAGSRFGMI